MASRSERLGVGPQTHDQIFITAGHMKWSSCCGAPSLTRGRVCNLLVQFAVTLRSKSLKTHDHICLVEDSPQPREPSRRIYIPQEQGGPVTPGVVSSPFVTSCD
jgi:hypothetical protein